MSVTQGSDYLRPSNVGPLQYRKHSYTHFYIDIIIKILSEVYCPEIPRAGFGTQC